MYVFLHFLWVYCQKSTRNMWSAFNIRYLTTFIQGLPVRVTYESNFYQHIIILTAFHNAAHAGKNCQVCVLRVGTVLAALGCSKIVSHLWTARVRVCSWEWGGWLRACPGGLERRAAAAADGTGLRTCQTQPVVSFWLLHGWSPCSKPTTGKSDHRRKNANSVGHCELAQNYQTIRTLKGETVIPWLRIGAITLATTQNIHTNCCLRVVTFMNSFRSI